MATCRLWRLELLVGLHPIISIKQDLLKCQRKFCLLCALSDSMKPGEVFIVRLYGRQLEKWEPDEDDTAMGLEDESSHETGKWDQFKANEKLFGVRTNFNMELYTAKLDASKSRFSVAEAEKLAREIAKDPTARNMLTDGQKVHVDDSGVSAEIKEEQLQWSDEQV